MHEVSFAFHSEKNEGAGEREREGESEIELNQRMAEGNPMRPCSDSHSPTQTASNSFCVTSSLYLLHRKVHSCLAKHARNQLVHLKDERARSLLQQLRMGCEWSMQIIFTSKQRSNWGWSPPALWVPRTARPWYRKEKKRRNPVVCRSTKIPSSHLFSVFFLSAFPASMLNSNLLRRLKIR